MSQCRRRPWIVNTRLGPCERQHASTPARQPLGTLLHTPPSLPPSATTLLHTPPRMRPKSRRGRSKTPGNPRCLIAACGGVRPQEFQSAVVCGGAHLDVVTRPEACGGAHGATARRPEVCGEEHQKPARGHHHSVSALQRTPQRTRSSAHQHARSGHPSERPVTPRA